ncbi:MAG: hypothetical protein ACXW6T_00260 [Candidatus Binatia bacterium]
MKKRPPPKPRSPAGKVLENPVFRQRIVADKRAIDNKRKTKGSLKLPITEDENFL